MTITPVSEDKLKGVRIGTKCCVLATGITQVLRINPFCFKSHLLVCPSEGMAGEMAAASAWRKDEDNFYEPVTGGAAAEGSCLTLCSLGATPTRPVCPKCAETEAQQAPHVYEAARGSGRERKTGRSRGDSLGPQNGPVAICKAGGVSFLEAGLRTCYMTWHLLTLISWNPFKISPSYRANFTSECSQIIRLDPFNHHPGRRMGQA